MATKHSFAPKLTESEATTLSLFNTADFARYKLHSTVMHLADRGLLVRRKDHTLDDTGTGWFRVTRRGKLMLQRYEIDKNTRWFAAHRESSRD